MLLLASAAAAARAPARLLLGDGPQQHDARPGQRGLRDFLFCFEGAATTDKEKALRRDTEELREAPVGRLAGGGADV